MILPKEHQDIFFENYFPLLHCAGIYEGILPETASFKEMFYLDNPGKAACRKALFEDKSFLHYFKEDNKVILKKDGAKLAFVNNVEKGLYGKFIFFKQNESGAVFLHADSGTFYEVTGITEPISKMSKNFPVVFETAIFNFKGKLICDGLILTNQSVLLEPSMIETIESKYKEALKTGQVLKKI